MKLHLSHTAGVFLITARGDAFVEINQMRHTDSFILSATAVSPWPVRNAAQLEREHLRALLALKPELILLGTGNAHRSVAPALYRDLIEAGIGVEVMSTDAACRTYNILVADGRRVAAALIIEAQ